MKEFYASSFLKKLITCCLLTPALLVYSLIATAEGSKELNQSGGNRAYLNSASAVSSTNLFPTTGTMKVFVNVGERIFVGSSAQGIGNGRINLRAPNGVTYTSGTSTTVGKIASRSQEVAGPTLNNGADGGYTPYIVTVGAGQAGIWEIDFVPPNATNINNPTAISSTAAWTQPTTTSYIAAFDVSVRNSANTAFIPGRMYTNIFTANLGAANATFNAIFYVLTNDGYVYTVNNNGQAGFGFSFIANNKGFRTSAGDPTYKSVDDLTALNMHDPRTADSPTDITHKIFFNTPSADLPSSASSVSGSTWLLTTPPVITASVLSFRGVEGTAGVAGDYPAGGYITFTGTYASNFNLDIDCNNNGVYTDSVDRRLTGSAVVGTNDVYWDGANGKGVKIPAGTSTYPMRVTLLAGEVHFPFIDVENNPNGIIITRVNGSGSPNNIVYWDDSQITVNGTPSNPIKTTSDGISSATNGHKFGSTAYSGTDFGNENGIDTWAYLQSTPVPTLLAITFREADLETTGITKSSTAPCVGQTITYTTAVRNNGPNAVTGASYRFSFPAELTNVTVTPALTSGASVITGGAVSGQQYNATLAMPNAAVVTFTVTGTIASYPTGGSLNVTSSIMRPADVTDPDATNPDAAPPTDPQVECDAAPSGVGCNNIKTDATTISQTPTTSNAGPAQTLCAATSTTLAGNTPTVGTGTWTQVSGPNTALITNPSSPTTTVSSLTTGAYVFRWTISNGTCTSSTSTVTITVQAALAGNTVTAPATTTFCGSGDAGVITGSTPTGGSGTYTYQWQQSTDNTTFTDISGATSASYDPPLITTTTYYRRSVVSGACTTPGYSNVVTITIQPAITNNTITAPATTTFCSSGDAAVISGTAPAGGSGAFSYQWQSSTDNSTFTNISGATAQTYDPPAATSTTYYRRLVTSGACSNASTSNVVTITIQPTLTAGVIAASQDFCVSGDPVAFTQTSAPTGGSGSYTYQWQSSTNNTTFTDISGATAATYDAPLLTTTTYFRRITRSGVCTDAISNVLTITVNPTLTPGAVSASQTFCVSGDPAVFTQTTAPTGGSGTYTYQWQSSTNNTTFTDISGATAATYDAPALSTTTYFRRITRSGNCADVFSNVLTVTINPAVSNNTIAAAQTICSGSTPAALTGSTPAGGNGTYTYLWEISVGGGAFTTAPGTSNGQNYTPGILTQTTQFRRTVTSDNCASSLSNVIQITVTGATTVANAGPDQGPFNGTSATLAGNAPVNGTGTWTQVSGPNTANIVNPAANNTSVTGLVPGTYTFRWTISNPPCASTNDDVLVIVNTAPVANNDNATTPEDVAVNINVISNDTDVDGTVVASSVSIVNQPANGSVSVAANGVVTYTPNANYNGSDVFSYTVRDNLNTVSNTATVSITITPVNDKPMATADVINIPRNLAFTLAAPGILANDVDVDGDQLSASIVTPVTLGTLVLNSNGSLTYTPPANYTGNATFTYRACDGSGACDTAQVTFVVGSVNRAPDAIIDYYTSNEDVVLNVAAGGVLTNDTDPDNDQLTATVVTQPASGTLALNADGSFRYTPVKDFNGVVSFVYRACDASSACDTATVFIRVVNVNDAPLAVDDSYSTNEDVNLTIAAPGVLFNDTDVDGDVLTTTVISTTTHGTLTLNANGSFSYIPAPDYNGIDKFSYRVCDNGTPSLCDTGEVTITIRPVNDTPAVVNDSYTLNEDNTLNIAGPGVMNNDTDVDGDALTTSLVSNVSNGTLVLRNDGGFTYTPNANYNGTDAFTYRACDPSGACATGTVTLNITPVNDAPVAGDVTFTATEDVTLSINPPGLLAASADVEGGTLTATLLTQPAHGTITVNPNGGFTYTPAANYNGSDQFTFTVCDNGTPVACDTATATISVTAVNDVPVAGDDTYTTAEDTQLNITVPGVLGNDTDVDGDNLTVSLLAGPIHGTATLNANGSFSYTPAFNYNGTDTYTYIVSDGKGGSDTGLVTITITPVNDAPISGAVSYNATEDVPLTVAAPGVLINDTDPDGDPLSATLIANAAHGTVAMNANGSFTYTPNPNFNGVDSFSYRVCDPSGACDTGVVYLNVAAANDAPVAGDDAYTTAEDTQLTVAAAGVLGNDTDVDGDGLSASVVKQPLHGTLTLNSNGGFSYTPGLNYNGVDSFTYRVCDGSGVCDTGVVNITITAVDDAPDAVDDVYTIAEDNTLSVPATGVLFNDTDPENDALTASLVTGPASGTLSLNANGSFSYTPAPDYNGTISFSYSACDPSGLCDTATVTITVTPVNDPPVAGGDSYQLSEDQPLTVTAPGVLTNDTDPDGDQLQVTGIARQPVHGTVTFNANGQFTYTPAPNYNGVDSFIYIVCDNNTPAACANGTVTLAITAENDAPDAGDDAYSTSEDVPLTIAAPGLLFNDTDVDGDPITITGVVAQPANGTVTVNANGGFTYTPAANYNGLDTFTYRVCDNNGACDTATARITVTPVNDSPIPAVDNYSTNEDVTLNIAAPGVLANDTDPDGDSLTVRVVQNPANGTLTLLPDGAFSYVPNANYNGNDYFIYNVCDGACVPDTAFITVVSVNDAPLAKDDILNTGEDITISGDASSNDVDVDGDPLTYSIVYQDTNQGTIILNPNGTFTYDPVANYNGVDSVIYKVCDPSGACDTAYIIVNIGEVNDPPVANPDTYTTPEDSLLTVPMPGLLANDTDPDNTWDQLNTSVVTPPANGSLTLMANGSFTYRPNPDYNGTDQFTYSTCDANGACDTSTATITVTPVNDPPNAVNDVLTIDEDSVGTGNVLTNDTDPENDALTASLLVVPASGTVVLNADGTYTYTPTANFNGTDGFTYRVCDNSGACDTGIVTITVNPVNDPPVTEPDNYNLLEDNTLTVVDGSSVLANDQDADGEGLVASVVTAPAHGTLRLNGDGTFTYTPAANYNGTDQFTYQACDLSGACTPGTVTLNIAPVNDAPVAVNDYFSRAEDTTITFPPSVILVNDYDVDGDTLTGQPFGNLQHGSYVANPNGTYTYTPAPDYNGLDSIQYQVCDGHGACDTGLIILNIEPRNDAPVANPDAYEVAEDNVLDVPVTAGVLVNDTDVDGDVLVAALVTPANGRLTLSSNGAFTYRPNQDFNGLDSFIYRACDVGGACDTSIVRIRVTPVNDAPVAVNDYFSRAEDTTITFPPSVILVNDYDVDGDALTGHPIGNLQHGSYVSNPDGTYTYTPAPNYNGLDSIQYQVCDNGTPVLCDTGLIILNIQPRNDAPVAGGDTYAMLEDGTLTVSAPGVLGNDNDVDDVTLSANMVTGPLHGTFTLNRNGSFTYTPVTNFNGVDTVVYSACDLEGACDTALILINVQPVADPPVAGNDVYTATEDVPLTIAAPGVLGNDSDPDAYPLVVSLVSGPANGMVVLNADGSFTYTPNADYNGTDVFTYNVCDTSLGVTQCNVGTVTINVTPVNDAPVGVWDSYVLSEDTALTVNAPGVLRNDLNVDGDPITAALVTGTVNGNLTVNVDGSLTYTPNPNYNGLDSAVYQVCDFLGLCDTAKVLFTVNSVNDRPVAVDDIFVRAEDTVITFGASVALINDYDVDGDSLTGRPITAPTKGSYTVNPDGTFTYRPNQDFNGTDSVYYEACDNHGACDTGLIRLIIEPRNDAPVAVNDSYTTPEDIVLSVPAPGVAVNDYDVDGDELNVSLLSGTVHGTVVINSDQSFAYTPVPNFNGVDSFTYRICDPSGLCATGVAVITVTSVNDVPVAQDNSYALPEDSSVVGNVLDNDSDADGDALTATLISGVSNGNLVFNGDGTFTYTPNANFNGMDAASYSVCDPSGACDTALISFIVTAVNDAPVAVGDTVSVVEDVVATGNVLANDTDVEGDALTASLVTAPVNGSVVLNADGTFTYTPNADYNGLDSLVYQVCDNGVPSLCDSGVVRFMVTAVNDAPVAVGDTVIVVEDVVATGNVLANDIDVEGDALTALLVIAPVNGSVVLNADGSFTYTPNANFNGADSLVYQVCDNGSPSLCDSGAVRFNVTAVNDAPEAVDDTVSVVEDVVATGNVLANDIDVEGDGLTASLVTAPVNGSVVLNADGSFTYTPNANFNGADSLVYQVCDNGSPSLCDSGVVRFNVTAVNDAPVAVDDDVTVTEDVAATGNVLTNDTDVEGNALTASLVTAPVNGTVVLNADGSFTYTPNANFNGSDSLVYQVCDNGTPSLCDSGVVRFTVTAVNDAPVAVNDTVSVVEDVPATGNVLTNDTDVEGNALTASLVTAPVNGTVVLNADGSFTYTPNSNYNGLDSLVYQVCDNGTPSLCDSGVVRFTVTAVNDAPVAVDDDVTVTEDVPTTGNVLTNDTDVEGNTLTASLVTAPVNGTVVLNADGSFTYTPNANFNGSDSLVYQVCDNGTPSLCDSGVVRFTVTAVNDAPVAVDDDVTVTEDVPATGNVLTNDTDVEGNTLTASLVTAPVNGTIVLNADGSFTYTPNANVNGLDSLVYQVCDNGSPSLCDSGVVRFTVTAVNDAPEAVDDTVSVMEDVPATGNVLTNDTDVEGNTLTASLVTAPVNGTVTLNADGSFTYTPNANFNGSDSLVYQVCDNGSPSLCDSGVVRFNVTAVNDAPVAVDDDVTVTEDVPATGNVLTNDTDVEGNTLTASLVTAPVNGTVVLNADGSFTYTPNANFNGSDSLVYQVCDNGTPSLCDSGVVRFTVTAVNDAPVAVDDTVSVVEDVPATGNVLTNDTDVEGNTLTASLVTAPVNGTVVLNADGSFTYTPNANFNGSDSLVYQVCDNGTPSLCDSGVVRFTVTAVNDAPVAVDDDVTVTEDVPATGNVLTNDTDVEGNTLTASLVTAPVNGTVILNADGSFTYTPNANFNGADSLVYQVCDNGSPSLCDSGVVRFTVTAVNDAPVAVNDTVSVVEDVPATGNVLTNDTDVEGNALTASLVTAPVNGTVVLNADGSFTYTPNSNYNGLDSLVYQVCDNGTPSLCDSGVVRFTVTAVNDAPVAVDDDVTVTEDVPTTGNVLTNDTDVEGNTLTASLVTAPVNGTVVLNADGSFTYTPNANFNGSDSLVYQVCDNGTPSLCDSGVVRFTVTAVNDAPEAVDDTVSVVEDVPATGNVLTNDTDVEGNTLTASLVTAPVNGSVVLNADGSFTYTPNANFNGSDSLVYQVCDNGTPSLCDSGVVRFTVTAVNDAPVAVDDTVSVVEDVAATGNVLTNDTDVEGNTLTASLVTAPINGSVVLNADGSFTYTPNANFNGADSLVYQVCDNGTPSLCDTAVVRFTVTSVNDAPVAVDDTVNVVEDVPATGNVLTNDTDVEGNTLTASLVTAPVNGTVTLNADGSFTYTPNLDYNGLDSLVYQVCDNGSPSLCDSGVVRFNVTAVNDAPVVVDDTVSVVEDVVVTGNVLTNDTDVEGNTLTASLVTAPVNGTVVLNADGSFTYTPNANFNGADSLVYQICDNGTPSLCDSGVVRFTVTAVNDAPVAVDDTVSVVEDVPATGNVLTNDTDVEGNTLTASLVTAPVNGTATLNADGSFTYTPNANFNGSDSLVYQVCDNGTPSLCDSGVVRFTITAVNDAPVAVDDTVSVVEDVPATGNVLTNDTDVEGNTLTASLVTAPVNGTATLNADGSFTYTPNANFNGTDSLVYQVCDNGSPSLCDSGVVRFTVTAVNDAPVAVDDTVSVVEDVAATGNVLTNDTDVEGNTLTASLVTAPINGSVVLNTDGSFTYTPNANFNGSDSLVYQVCDNGTPILCDSGVVRFTVTAVNDAPVAVDDTVSVVEDVPATGNVLTNDTDVEGNTLTASLVTAPVNGTVVLNADGSFTYTPNANFNGSDSLVYQVCDNGTPSLCDSGVVRFTVTAVNDAPVAVDDTVSVVEDVPATGNVLTNDTDVEGNALTASLVTAPVNGTVILNADGSFTYTPNANFNGADSLVYQVCDNGTPSLCDSGVVRFTVTAVNDAPEAVDDTVNVVEDVPATGNVLTNDTDVEGNTLTASLVTAPENGTVVLNADGSFTYTPNANFNGSDSLVYQVCDNGTPSLCDSGVVRFTVTAVNDAPLAVDDTVSVVEDVPATGNVLTNDADVEGNALTASLVTAPVNGTVILNADGSFTYTPNANFNGADSLVYQVCDNGTPSLCDSGVVRFMVTAVNDAPEAVDDTVSVVEDVPATGNVLTNDTDVEGNTLTASLVTAPVNGTVVLNADGSFTYTPNANFNGADSLVYQVCDNGTPSLCDSGVVRFTVTAVNDAPVAMDDDVTVTEDVAATGNVLTNDTDVEGNTLTASLVTAPVNGTVVLNADGSFTYTPNANFNGSDSLVYQICDNGTPSLCDIGVVRFTVTAVNDAPVAVDDDVTVTEDVPATGNVLTNDTDVEGNTLTTSLVTAPVNGTVTLNADGSFTYTPNANFNGADSLVYQVCDNGTPSLCDSGVVRFNVTAVNDAPIAVDDDVTVTEDVPATGNVLTNDTDIEGNTLTASLVIAPINGTVVLNADGSFTYTPNSNYNGLDSLVYQVCDNGTPSLCDSGVVRFTVTSVNDAPVAVDDNVTVTEDVAATGNVLGNDSDPEGNALTASLVTAPVNGTVVLNADGSFTYTPNANFNGSDSLVYQVCDNGVPSLCDSGVVRFTITAVNDAPVAVDDDVTVTEDVPATGNVLTNDTDVEGNTLTASLVTAPVNGTVVLNADGSFTYTP
ncbi:Ig-like domain-containing protein, partial [Chitinophaga silvisoli]